jgi:uncharacterized protein (DUF433 family)
LGELVYWVLGADLSEPKQAEKQPVVKQPTRKPPARGDGFDVKASSAPVALGNVDVPVAPATPVAPTPGDFTASFDDLKDLVDEPMEPRAEFVPEGGMSTESLMREFESLDAELQAKAVVTAASVSVEELEPRPSPLDGPLPQMATESLMSEFESLAPAEKGAEAQVAGAQPMATESLMSEFDALTPETQAAAIELAERQARDAEKQAAASEFLERERTAQPMATESLMSEFDALTPETQAAAIELAERQARERAEAAQAAAPEFIERERAAQPMATESLMSEFDALTPETQAAAIELAERQARERAEAEQARAEKQAAPQRIEGERTAQPMATESLMSEFDALTPETQAAAIKLAERQARERAEAEQARAAEKQAVAPELVVPERAVTEPQASALTSEFASLDAETQAAALEFARRQARARAEAQAKTEAPPPKKESLQPAWLLPVTTPAPPRKPAITSEGFDASPDDVATPDDPDKKPT